MKSMIARKIRKKTEKRIRIRTRLVSEMRRPKRQIFNAPAL